MQNWALQTESSPIKTHSVCCLILPCAHQPCPRGHIHALRSIFSVNKRCCARNSTANDEAKISCCMYPRIKQPLPSTIDAYTYCCKFWNRGLFGVAVMSNVVSIYSSISLISSPCAAGAPAAAGEPKLGPLGNPAERGLTACPGRDACACAAG